MVNLKLIWLQMQRTVNLWWSIKWHLVHEVVDVNHLTMTQLTRTFPLNLDLSTLGFRRNMVVVVHHGKLCLSL